jgi:hypothetical protein
MTAITNAKIIETNLQYRTTKPEVNNVDTTFDMTTFQQVIKKTILDTVNQVYQNKKKPGMRDDK